MTTITIEGLRQIVNKYLDDAIFPCITNPLDKLLFAGWKLTFMKWGFDKTILGQIKPLGIVADNGEVIVEGLRDFLTVLASGNFQYDKKVGESTIKFHKGHIEDILNLLPAPTP